MHHEYHESRGRGENGGGDERVLFVLFLEWPSPFISEVHKSTQQPSFCVTLVRTRSHASSPCRKGRERKHLARGLGCNDSAALHGTELLLATRSVAAKEVTCCLAHGPPALYLSHSRKSIPIASWGLRGASNLPKWWQVVPGDPGRTRILQRY